ncbi:MAG: hypothetical protein GY805_12505, partial [Chloroflexi bacterium]|nr:hypothetical protein [Chloroflexota bacterium]
RNDNTAVPPLTNYSIDATTRPFPTNDRHLHTNYLHSNTAVSSEQVNSAVFLSERTMRLHLY